VYVIKIMKKTTQVFLVLYTNTIFRLCCLFK